MARNDGEAQCMRKPRRPRTASAMPRWPAASQRRKSDPAWSGTQPDLAALLDSDPMRDAGVKSGEFPPIAVRRCAASRRISRTGHGQRLAAAVHGQRWRPLAGRRRTRSRNPDGTVRDRDLRRRSGALAGGTMRRYAPVAGAHGARRTKATTQRTDARHPAPGETQWDTAMKNLFRHAAITATVLGRRGRCAGGISGLHQRCQCPRALPGFHPGPTNTVRNRAHGSENIGAAMNVACAFESVASCDYGTEPHAAGVQIANNGSPAFTASPAELSGYLTIPEWSSTRRPQASRRGRIRKTSNSPQTTRRTREIPTWVPTPWASSATCRRTFDERDGHSSGPTKTAFFRCLIDHRERSRHERVSPRPQGAGIWTV